ncbi:Uncharacterised protein [Shigella sonnei]|nr:Uncharacterised protein [Shigella sonnei]SIZ54453.1 Uncharacterised protein [Shigella sonnei]
MGWQKCSGIKRSYLAFNRFYLDSALLIGNVEIMKAA